MHISRLSSCFDESYPTINWTNHASMAKHWLEIDTRHKAGLAVDDLLSQINYQLQLTERWPQVDCVSMVPGLAISTRAKVVFESLGVPAMQFLEFKINGDPYFLFFTERIIHCLDRQRSVIQYFPHAPERVMDIDKYAFHEEQLQACDVFTIRESSDAMFFWSHETFFTKPARRAIEQSGLVGFRFEETQ